MQSWAAQAAEQLLRGLGARWQHVQGVAERVRRLNCSGSSDEALIAAAYLHDIGHAPALIETGLHALDGARHLRRLGVDESICRLVAYHSCAQIEAEERNLSSELTEFEPIVGEAMDILVWGDMTTDHEGRPIAAERRIGEILRRYGPEDPVYRATLRARPLLLASVRRVGMSADVGRY